MNNKFDCVLLEKEIKDGLTKDDIVNLLNLTACEQVIPFEVESENSVAMGFMSLDAAKEICYQYNYGSQFYQFIQSILSDMNEESSDGTYNIEGLSVLLTRNL